MRPRRAALHGTAERVDAGLAPTTRHLRAEAGGFLSASTAIALSSRLGLPHDGGLLRDVGVPSGMMRLYRIWPSGSRIHAAIGAGFVRYPVAVDAGPPDAAMDTVLTGPR